MIDGSETDNSADFLIRQLLFDSLIEPHLVFGDTDFLDQAIKFGLQLNGDARTARVVDQIAMFLWIAGDMRQLGEMPIGAAVAVRIQATENRRPARRTQRRRAERVLEEDPFASQPVDVRRLQMRMPGGTQAIPTQVIAKNEQDAETRFAVGQATNSSSPLFNQRLERRR